MSGEDPDRALVEAAQAQLPYGTAAYDQLVRRHSDAVYRRCVRLLQSQADAEEVSQEVFLAVFRALPRYRFERPFLHWLNTITLNACRMALRRRANEQRRRRAVEERSPPPPTPEPRNGALRRRMVEILDDIDPGTRIAVLMHHVEGYTYTEIAAQLELSESAVKMRVSRGARRLRELYEERVERPARAPGAEGPDDA